MKTEIMFFWHGIPPKSTFQQRDKNFHPTPCARLAMAQWQAILEPHVPEKPLHGPLELSLILTWPHTQKTCKGDFVAIPKTTRPDGVNILKGVEDIMTRLGYWDDDSLLSRETVERWHGKYPGVCIWIRSIA